MTSTAARLAPTVGSASPYAVAARLWTALGGGTSPRRAAWLQTRRQNQTPPDGDWFVWLIMAGRGFGKGRTASEEVAEQCRRVAGSQVVMMGRTDAETRRVNFEGRSGLKGVCDPAELEGGSWKNAYRATPGDTILRFANGSVVRAASSSGYEAVRGLNLDMLAVDELASWRNQEDVWDEVLLPAVRIGDHPRIIVTTTPRPTKLIRRLVVEDGTEVTRGSTWDNAANLAPKFIAAMHRRYDGTRAGRQELEGELLDDVEGAVWQRAWIEDNRVTDIPADALIDGKFRRVVVGGDPSDGTASGDACGLTVTALGYNHELYVLESEGMAIGVLPFLRALIDSTKAYAPVATLVVEKNHGGEYLVQSLRQIMREKDTIVPYSMVTASVGKRTRAEPVAALYAQGRVHHVGVHADLESEMCSWTGKPGEKSPDRMDSCFVPGTPVLTSRGNVPIEHVRVGDMAWTRAGWRPVTDAWMARRDAEVGTVTLSDGQTLTGTPDHRVWVEGHGWTRLDTLACGDRLSAWTQSPHSRSDSTGTPTDATPKVPNDRTASTTPNAAPDGECSTAPSGHPSTETSPTASTSTTSTGTRSTTTPRTSKLSLLLNTARNTHPRCVSGGRPTPRVSGPSQKHGTPAPKASNGIGKTESLSGRDANRTLSWSASSVGTTSPPTSPTRLNIAPTPVGNVSHVVNTDIKSAFPARFAARSSGKTSTGPSPRPAVVCVARSYVADAQRSDVYDLTIEGEHEFVAAGVIVHNCVWSVSPFLEDALALTAADAEPNERDPGVNDVVRAPQPAGRDRWESQRTVDSEVAAWQASRGDTGNPDVY